MNYYEHHIGDYDADTAHLTWLEDMAYTRLIRLYYRREKPIPADLAQACRLVRASSKDERKAVELILGEFFVLGTDGWTQARCDAEISIYQKRVEHNRRVGKLGGRPRKVITQTEPEQNPMGYFREPGQNPPQTPDPRPQYSDTDVSGGDAAKMPEQLTKDELWSVGKSLLIESGMPAKQCGSFVGKLVKDYTDEIVIEAVRKTVVERPADPASYLKALCQTAKGQRLPANKQEALEKRNGAIANEWAAAQQPQGEAYETQ